MSPLRKLVVVILLALAGACGGSIPPPSSPPAYTDAAPALAEGAHAVHTATREINADATTVRSLIDEGRMLTMLRSTSRVSKPASYEMLQGTWPEEGAVRRVRQEDGHYVAERIVSRSEEGFVYQIWAPTTAAGRNILYGRGEFRVVPLPDGRCELTWSYALRAKQVWARPFVGAFVRDHFAPFMEAGLDAFVESVEQP